MLGLIAIMLVLFGLILLTSYWISWDMQPRGQRPSFATKVANDLVVLLAQCRAFVANRGGQSLTARPVRISHAGRSQSLKPAMRPVSAVANRS